MIEHQFRCAVCGFSSVYLAEMPPSPEDIQALSQCPVCDSPVALPYGMALATEDNTAASPLDAAIAAGPAIDRAADGKADLRVRSPFEKEAERLRLAKYFREHGVL